MSQVDKNPNEIILRASPVVQQIIKRVVQEEYLRLHLKSPYGIKDVIEKIIKEEVK